jgi:hypothetical protein
MGKRGSLSERQTRKAIEGMGHEPFTVADLVEEMKKWTNRPQTTDRIAAVLRKMIRLGEVVTGGYGVSNHHRQMAEAAGLTQGLGASKAQVYVTADSPWATVGEEE